MKKTIVAAIALLMILAILSGCAALGLVKSGDQTPESSVSAGEETEADESKADETAADDSQNPETSPSPEETDESEADETVPVADYSAVEVTTKTYTYSSDYIDVSLETPRITGLADSDVQNSINAVFIELDEASQASVETLESESKEIAEEGFLMGAYQMYMGYEVKYLDDGILSLTITDYMYLGGAHGSAILMAYTFDLETGMQLSLDDLMGDSAYRDVVNQTIRDEIDRRIAEEELYELAVFEDIGDTAQWFLANEVIVFYFQQYEYFPYAAGIQQFSVMYEALEGFLDDAYAEALLG